MGHFKPVETEYDLDRSFEPVKVRTLKCFRNAIQVSPFCLVELWLAIFWAVFTGFSFQEVFYASSKILQFSSKQGRTSGLFVFISSKGDNGFENILK